MVANKRDGNVSFAQGVEFFTALRRLGKRVWIVIDSRLTVQSVAPVVILQPQRSSEGQGISVMKTLFVVSFVAACYASGAFAQTVSPSRAKPPVDTSALDRWPSAQPTWVEAKARISNDGRYALYRIRTGSGTPSALVVRAIRGPWQLELPDVGDAVFTEDSRSAVFIKSSTSLCVLTLGRSSISCTPSVDRFELFKRGRVEWLAYLSDTTRKRLLLRNLATGETHAFPDASDYSLTRDGRALVLKTEKKTDTGTAESLSWVSLSDGTSEEIWEGANASNLVLDDAGVQLAFRVEDKLGDQTASSLWYYKHGTARAVRLATDQSAGIDGSLQFDGVSSFSRNGSKLFIRLAEKDVSQPKPDAVKVDVWSYTDAKLQSQQLNERGSARSYTAALDLHNHRVTRLEQESETVVFGLDELGGDLVLVSRRAGEASEWNWNATARPTFFLVSTATGERRELAIDDPQMILDGTYILWLDRDGTDLHSYEVKTGIARNLTGSLPIPVGGVEYDEPSMAKSRGLWIAGPAVNNRAVIVYDDYDIWQLDPSGSHAPVNLTNGYGRNHGIVLRLAAWYGSEFDVRAIPNRDELILRAVDRNTENSGFYTIDAGKQRDPRLLATGPYHYEPGYRGATQIKARDAQVYIVMRESASESPNYFWTDDLKRFTPLSSIYPERSYNWLTAELISFTTLDRRAERAVLYKPENFDPTRKYPVILHYYERKTQELNLYPKPGGFGHLDIAWFVSHGYIVVTPDIQYRIGETGQSALNAVVGAARHLSRLSWVDSTRIGLQGHSFGGYETNYIVTQTDRFAAAVSSSGMSDIISNYLGFLGDHTNHDWYENRFLRMGATLWEMPDLYTKNSPVIYADKVTTPILTVANKRDQNVRFEQGLEWFIALRRLGKRVWMLQYDEGTHGVGGKDYKDYVIRMTQFFDHYLKGAPAPMWMTQGVPARLKGIETGLELDEPGTTPGPGLLAPRTSRAQSDSAF